MTSTTRLSTIEAIYNKRASSYDSEGGFHPVQAADYIKWMNLEPGQHVLDLACGTGAIAIPASKIVGPSGKVVGIDISGDSLAIAKSKAEKEGAGVTFIQHDVADLGGIDALQGGSFDVISCGSAFVLFEDHANTIKGWTKLLKVGGKMIFDVPTSTTMVGGWVLNVVGHTLNMPVAFDRTKLDSVEKVNALLLEAGLNDSETFVSKSYNEKELDVKDAGQLFESIVGRQDWFEDVYAGFKDPTRKEPAKEMFCEEMRNLADGDGKIKEELRFIMVVGRKV